MNKEEIIILILKRKWKICMFLSKPLIDYEFSELKLLAELLGYDTTIGNGN